MKLVVAACLALVVGGAVLAQQPAGGLKDAGAGKPVVRWMGSYSRIGKARIELVRDGAAWEALWREHMGEKIEKNANGFETWPAVDFTTHAVVAVFDGAARNSNGFEAESVREFADHVRVRYDNIRFQTASFDGKDSGIATTSFGFFVIPRPMKEVVLEENVQGLIGQPPKWKEQRRFAAGVGRQN